MNIYADPRDRNGKAIERTDIVCQHFVDAVEKNLYGWFWECPNGGEKCVYTHALPQGYILERDRKEMEKARLMGDDDDELTLEEKIEEERLALPTTGLTPVTLKSLNEWKLRKAEKKQKELEDRMKEEAKAGNKKGFNILSGKALFKYDPTLFKDDEEAADEDIYQERTEEEEEEEKKQQEQLRDGDDNFDEEEERLRQEEELRKRQDQEETKEGEAAVDKDLFAQEADENDDEEVDFE